MKKIKSGVYKIKCLEDNMIYIGSSKNIKRRWQAHKYELRKGNHANMFLQEGWDKHGEKNFEFSILEECPEEDRFELEQGYLNNLKPFYRTGGGYNICENVIFQNNTDIKIFKSRYFTKNPFKGMSEKTMEKVYREEYSHIFNKFEINNTSSILWYDINGAYYMVKPYSCKARAIDSDIVNSMTRKELDTYCAGLDTYDELKQMAMDGYMDINDWI